MSNSDDGEKGVEAFDHFFGQFGPMDVYMRVIWEEIFKELMGVSSDDEEGEDADGRNDN